MDRACSRVIVPMLLIAVFAGLLGMTGCAKPAEQTDSGASVETTIGQFPAEKPAEPQVPPMPTLTTPRNAIGSYLNWVSFAYRTLTSNVATPTMTAWEEVGISSYVEYNREQGRAIDQRLLSFDQKSSETKGATATVTAREYWKYRYININTGKYLSDVLDATYDTTYTVVKENGDWKVQDVVATPVGEAPK